MRFRSSHRTRTGFTLLEVLLAVAVLGMLMTAVYSTWSAALTSWRRGSDASEAFQRQRVVMDALMELTQSAIYFAPSAALYAFIATKNPGLGDSISFVTASDAYLPPSETIAAGMRRVTISLEQDQYRRTYLAIVNEPALRPDDDKTLEPPQAHVISMDVSGFYVRYRDPRDGTWSEKWEEQAFPPSAVEYTVVFGEQGGRFPPLVITRPVDIPVAAFVAAGGMPIPGIPGMPGAGTGTNSPASQPPAHSFGPASGGASATP
jgi:prepilin-type N-terminal cleavage/methylation domain-containing protein